MGQALKRIMMRAVGGFIAGMQGIIFDFLSVIAPSI